MEWDHYFKDTIFITSLMMMVQSKSFNKLRIHDRKSFYVKTPFEFK